MAGWDDFPIAPLTQAAPDAPTGLVVDITKGARPGAAEGQATAADPWEAFPKAAEPLPIRTTAEQAGRGVGLGAQGFNDAVADTLAFPFNASAAITNRLGITQGPSPVGPAIKSGIDYVGTLPGRVVDAIGNAQTDSSGALDATGGVAPDVSATMPASAFTDQRTTRLTPETEAERIYNKVGQFAGQTAATFVPGMALARPGMAVAPVVTPALQVPTRTQALGQLLTAGPKTQAAAALAGGVTAGHFDSDLKGVGAQIALPIILSGGRRVMSPVVNRSTPHELATQRFAAQEGVPVTAGQATNSPVLRGVEASLNDMPIGSGPMRSVFQRQREAFNRSTLDRAGITANHADPQTLLKNDRRLGATFDNLEGRTTLNFGGNSGGQFVQDLRAVEQAHGRMLGVDQKAVFNQYMRDLEPLLQDIQSGATRQITGDRYRQIATSLRTRIRNTSDYDLRESLRGIQNALDGVMERSVSGGLRDEWQQARAQYQAHTIIENAMTGGTQADRAAGNIPYGALRGAVANSDRAGFAIGRGQMNNAAQLADFLSTRVPNSGTAQRVSTQAIMAGAGGAAVGGVDPLTVGAAVLAPSVASRVYNNPLMQGYLQNQIARVLGSPGAVAPSAGVLPQQEAQWYGDQGNKAALASLLRRTNERRVNTR